MSDSGGEGDIEIRPATAGDAGTLSRLLERMTPGGDGPGAPRGPRLSLLAFRGADAVGLLQVSLPTGAGGAVRLIGVHVDETHRRSGVARALVAEMEIQLRRRGVTRIELELVVGADGVPRGAHATAEALGFEAVAQIRRYHRPLDTLAPVAARVTTPVRADGTSPAELATPYDAPAPPRPALQPVTAAQGPGPLFWALNGLLGVVALLCLLNTNIFSPDPIRGALLPLLDVLFLLYFAGVFAVWRYRRRTAARASAAELFDVDSGPGD